MGRATIVAEKGEGLYTIDIDTGSAERDAAIAKYEKVLAETEENIPELTDRRDDARSDVIAARNSLNNSISFLVAAQAAGNDTTALEQEVALKREIFSEKESIYESAQSALESEQSRKLEAEEKITYYENLAVVLRVDAWSVDYSLGLTGTVATTEINGTTDEILILGTETPVDADGRLLMPNVMSPSQAYFNYAIFDGWQKWKPTSRTATLTAKNNDGTVNVELDTARSHAQNLNINQASILENLPVFYSSCNETVFNVGDKVIVYFNNKDWAQPRVIGFRSNPKACSAWAYLSDTFVSSPKIIRSWQDLIDPPANDVNPIDSDGTYWAIPEPWEEYQLSFPRVGNYRSGIRFNSNVGINYRSTPSTAIIDDSNALHDDFYPIGALVGPITLSPAAEAEMESNPLSVTFNVVGKARGSIDFTRTANFLGYYPVEEIDWDANFHQFAEFSPYYSDLLGRRVGYWYRARYQTYFGAAILIYKGADNHWRAVFWLTPKADFTFASSDDLLSYYANDDTYGTIGGEITMKKGSQSLGSPFKFQLQGFIPAGWNTLTNNINRTNFDGGVYPKAQVDQLSYPEGTRWLSGVERADL